MIDFYWLIAIISTKIQLIITVQCAVFHEFHVYRWQWANYLHTILDDIDTGKGHILSVSVSALRQEEVEAISFGF